MFSCPSLCLFNSGLMCHCYCSGTVIADSYQEAQDTLRLDS